MVQEILNWLGYRQLLEEIPQGFRILTFVEENIPHHSEILNVVWGAVLLLRGRD